jgi:mono/diheme cytochrome c family protein
MGTRRDVSHSTASGFKSVRTTTSTPGVFLACAGLGLLAALAFAPVDVTQRQPWPNADADPTVTPVVGPSWLTHLGTAVDTSRLGRGGAVYGPGGDARAGAPQQSLGVPRTFTMTGADLYRLNCQACHLAQGTGSPPEISSVLGPVHGASLEAVRKRLRDEPHPSSDNTGRGEAAKARAAIFARIHKGGRMMPPRDYLRDEDTQLLFGYLTELAGNADAERHSSHLMSWARVGEQVIKGTCHVCHDATGPRPTNAEILRGSLPSLASMLATKPVAEFVQKARAGAPVAMGDPALLHRGRMPVFHYLRDEEVAAAYVYLATYLPRAN